ncbi:MAG: TIR domain-containing protein [Pseudomonadota bacterium]|nr:TIR domain-containing protein [Pseudomonadota bacterium]
MNKVGVSGQTRPPVVFLSHASEDKTLAREIAARLFENGMEVFFDEWEIRAGDSLLGRIDVGLGRCTHFVVLLTPHSVEKAWVRAEMDAAFVKRVEGECRFIPLRHNLQAQELPPLLRGLLSPEIKDIDEDIARLIEDIREIDRRPSTRPRTSDSAVPTSGMGLSPAAAQVVELIVRGSKHGLRFDPQLSPEDVQQGTTLSDGAIREAVEELIERGVVEDSQEIGSRPLGFSRLYPQGHLFALFDGFFMKRDPAEDALRIAADLVNESRIDIRLEPKELAGRYEWEPRRLNPAIAYLSFIGAAKVLHALGTAPFECAYFWLTNKARRFVRAHDEPDAVLKLVRSKRGEILEIAERNRAFNPRIFGSSVRGERHADSDIDLLVSLKPQASLGDIVRMKAELEELLKAPVDLIDEGSLLRGIRKRVLAEAQPI